MVGANKCCELCVCDSLWDMLGCVERLYEMGDIHMSHEKNPGWLGYIGDYTTQIYRDYNKPL